MATRKSAGKKTARKAKAPRSVNKARVPARRLAKRRSPESLRLRGITPGFTSNDLERSVAFYTDVLGFMVSERWSDEGLRGVMLKAGACELGLSQDDWAKGRDRKKGEGVRIWCETAQDVDAVAARVKAAGFSLTEEPKDQPWGARSFSVDDPDGYHLTIARKA